MKDRDFGTICLCAVRYAIGRQTYMPSLVQDFVKRNAKAIGTQALSTMLKDVSHEIERAERNNYLLGASFDHHGWEMFRDWLAGLLADSNGK